MTRTTINECLNILGVTAEAFANANTLTEEFAAIKRVYFKKILQCHPDKGGDVVVFRQVQTSFEILRERYASGRIRRSFADELDATATAFDDVFADFGNNPTPSYDFYAEAAASDAVPLYRVETAKSGRSKCRATTATAKKCHDPIIDKDELRVGVLDPIAGSYTRWVHLACWRVPSRVWRGLPDPAQAGTDGAAAAAAAAQFRTALLAMNEVLLCGVYDLNAANTALFLAHVMDKSNWARWTKPRRNNNATPAPAEPSSSSPQPSSTARQSSGAAPYVSSNAVAMAPSSTLVATSSRPLFVMPVPGRNGAVAEALRGKTVVLTGIFPEVGGGAGLHLGKDRVKRMVESFGGRVTSSVSGKTDMLIVGKEPGFAKVSQARNRGTQLLGLKDVAAILEGRLLENDDAEHSAPLVIDSFSSGYKGNSLALTASQYAYDIAVGSMAPAPTLHKPKSPSPQKKKTPPAAAKKPAGRATVASRRRGGKVVKTTAMVAAVSGAAASGGELPSRVARTAKKRRVQT